MNDDPSDYEISDPDIFSRGTLDMTYQFIRNEDPALALEVRNIAHGDPLPKKPGAPDNKNADHFRVHLDSFQVRAIVEGLMRQEQGGNAESIMIKAVIGEWIQLAHKMIDDLPDDEKPPMM